MAELILNKKCVVCNQIVKDRFININEAFIPDTLKAEDDFNVFPVCISCLDLKFDSKTNLIYQVAEK